MCCEYHIGVNFAEKRLKCRTDCGKMINATENKNKKKNKNGKKGKKLKKVKKGKRSKIKI